MNPYYETLSLEDTASLEEIKNAYFPKVKPAFDKQDREEGLQLFSHVHEAFAFVTGKSRGVYFDVKKQTYQDLRINTLADWENKFEQRQESLQEQAVHLYGLGESGFFSSNYYKTTLQLKAETIKGKVGLAVFITLVVPVAFTLLFGTTGLALGMVFVYSTSRYCHRVFRQLFFSSKSVTEQGLAYFLNTDFLFVIVFLGSNLYLFFFSTSRTFILFKPLIAIFIIAVFVGFLVPTRKLGIFKSHSRIVSGLGFFPFILNFFFAINLYFSSPLYQEYHEFYFEYEYIPGDEYSSGETDIKPRVYFENDLYEGYLQIRQFMDRDEIRDKYFIHMNIHRGLFGIKVLKSWRLE
jgi:hypothetical protein